jgi:LmbE family N-acetylglucosaminyl deacetylase
MKSTQAIHYNNKKLLAVLAHPDDETFGVGGTLALYASKGVEVYLVCATRGEAGDVPPEYQARYKSPACLRTQELNCAAEILGIREVRYLNYRDSGMEGSNDNYHPEALAIQPIEAVAEKIREIMHEVKPQVVITFDPIGGYRHPDHIAVHQATVLAFYQLLNFDKRHDGEAVSAFQPQRLYFHTMNRVFLGLSIFLMRLTGYDPRRYGRNKDIDLVSIYQVRFPAHVRIKYSEVNHLRKQAAACHASQGGGLNRKGVIGLIRKIADRKEETYMQAFPAMGDTKRVSHDLFEGIK